MKKEEYKMLTKKTAEAAYADFLTQTNYKRLPKTAGALFTQLEKQLRTIDETETTAISRPLPPLFPDGKSRQSKT